MESKRREEGRSMIALAKIRGMEEQQQALSSVQSYIKQLQNLRKFLTTNNPSEQYEIIFKIPATDGEPENEKQKQKRVAVKFRLSDRDTLKLVLAEHEEYLVQEIRSLVGRYNIVLENEEEALLS